MDFFKTAFYRDSLALNQKLRGFPIIQTTFPEMSYICDNDCFQRELWKMMDEAKHYIWLMTYTFDNSVSANFTLKKLIEAQKRGVKVCLMIDDLNNRADKELKKELADNGAMVHTLNKILPYWTGLQLSREMFRRHHEKVVIADDMTILGSANIADDYSGPVYGSFDFVDLNIKMRNVCLSQVRTFFGQIAQGYGYNLDRNLTNEEIIQQYNEQFPNSTFSVPKVRLIRTQQPHIEEIQQFLLQKINEAKESIKIIQPYYYPIRKFDKALLQALKRGVSVELVTAGKRDQPAYAPLKNILLMNNLIKNGLKVHEIRDKLLHMKLYQFDDKLYTSGSFNNDWWSWDINNELNIVVEGREEVARMGDIFNEVKAKATPLDPDMEVGVIRYVKVKFWESFLAASDWIMNKKRHYRAQQKLKEYKDFKRTLKEKNDAEALESLKRLKSSKYKRMFMDWDDSLGTKF